MHLFGTAALVLEVRDRIGALVSQDLAPSVPLVQYYLLLRNVFTFLSYALLPPRNAGFLFKKKN